MHLQIETKQVEKLLLVCLESAYSKVMDLLYPIPMSQVSVRKSSFIFVQFHLLQVETPQNNKKFIWHEFRTHTVLCTQF